MQRLLQGTPATITVTFSIAGVDTDPSPDTATVRVVTDDGTELVPSTAAQNTGTGTFAYTLTAAQTASLDRLTAYWTVTIAGQPTTLPTVHEIAGGFLFTTAQLRALVPDTPDAKLQEVRIYAETELERALGFALVPRYDTRTFWARRADRIRLRPFVRTVRSATIGGTAVSAANLARLVYSQDGYVAGYSWWNGQVVVRYEHGMDSDNDLSSGANRAALALAVDYLGGDTGSVDPRAERLITDDGTIVYGSAAGGAFSSPDVNRWVRANGLPRAA